MFTSHYIASIHNVNLGSIEGGPQTNGYANRNIFSFLFPKKELLSHKLGEIFYTKTIKVAYK